MYSHIDEDFKTVETLELNQLTCEEPVKVPRVIFILYIIETFHAAEV